MIQRILSTMALFMLLIVPPVYGQQSPEKVQQKVAQAKSVEAGAQAKQDGLNREKQEIIQEIQDAKNRLSQLKYRQEKTRKYIAHAKQSIEDLEHTKEEFSKLQAQLKSYLEGVILRLEDFVDQDLPFLPDERSKRISGLKTSMEKTDMPLSELLRIVFEVGLMIETQYGKGVDASENETLNVDGVDTEVVIFRMGRLEMYYMSLDGRKTGFYNRLTGNWEPLPESMNQEIKLAVKIAQHERTVELINLPIGGMK